MWCVSDKRVGKKKYVVNVIVQKLSGSKLRNGFNFSTV